MGLFGLRVFATVVSLEMVLLMRGLPARELFAANLDGLEALFCEIGTGPVKRQNKTVGIIKYNRLQLMIVIICD